MGGIFLGVPKMKLTVQQVSLQQEVQDIPTHQWMATVWDNGRKVFTSTGYNYATEAREAGLCWMELQESGLRERPSRS